MAVRIQVLKGEGSVRAHATVSLAPGVWLSGIQVVQAGSGLKVVFPTSLVLDPSGTPQVQALLAFDQPETRRKWEDRIIAAFQDELEKKPPPAKLPPRKPSTAPAPPPPPPKPEPPPPPYLAYVDGGARGAPGPAAAAALLCLPGRPPIELMQFLGEQHASYAQYAAVLLALGEVERLVLSGVKIPELTVRADSPLVVKHFLGQWKVKDPELARLAGECRALAERLKLPVKYESVRIEQNEAADALVHRCLEANA